MFRLTFAERIAESKVRTQRNAQRKFSLSDWLSPNQKRHFTFWLKFGLSLKYGLSERLMHNVYNMQHLNSLHKVFSMADLYKPDAGLTVGVPVGVDDPREQRKDEDDEKGDKYNAGNVGVSRPRHGLERESGCLGLHQGGVLTLLRCYDVLHSTHQH